MEMKKVFMDRSDLLFPPRTMSGALLGVKLTGEAQTSWGRKGSSIGDGRGLWGKQTRLVRVQGEAAELAGTMPASWRDDCPAARAAACRMGNPGSSQRDSEAADSEHKTLLSSIHR